MNLKPTTSEPLPKHYSQTFEDTLEVRSVEAIAAIRNRRLYQWWLNARGDQAMPSYRAFDPVALPWALGHVSLVSVLDDGDYLYRVDGTYVAEYFGIDMTGTRLSNYPGADRRKRIIDSFELIRRVKGPVKIRRDVVVDNRSIKIHILLLPFSNDGTAVTEIMSCLAQGRDLHGL